MALTEGLDTADNLPHPISHAILARAKIDSFNELPKEKQPPRDLWFKSHKLEKFFDEVFNRKDDKEETKYVEFNEWEVE